MSDSKRTSPSGAQAPVPASDRNEIDAAIGGVVEEVEAKKEKLASIEDPAVKSARRRAIVGPVALVLSCAMLLYVWSNPSWLQNKPLPDPTPEEQEEALRLEMYHLALAILDHQETEGALPDSLGQLEVDVDEADGIEYLLRQHGQFRLLGTNDRTFVEFVSSQDPDVLMRGYRAQGENAK